MDEKRRAPKRKGKSSYKKLNIKEKRKQPDTVINSQEIKPSVMKRVNDFKASGLTLLKGKKDEKKLKINLKWIISVVVAIVIILSIVIVCNSPTGVVEFISSKIALSKSGGSFPVEDDFSSGRKIYYSNGSLLVITETDLKCYNKTGNAIYTRPHGFSEPVIKTSKIRTLIYGLNDSHYRVETPEEEIISKKTENNMAIVSGDIADNGDYILATEASEDIALVTAFSKDGAETFKYHSVNNYITNVSISEDGNRICIVSLSTKKAEFISKIMVFNIDETKPFYTKELNGEVVYCVEFADKKNLSVLTDKQYMNIDDEVTNSFKYNPEFLNKFEISDKYIVLYNTADSNSSKGNIYVLSKAGDRKAKFTVDGNISDVSVYKNSIFTLGEKVNEYDFDGKKTKSSKINNGAINISAMPGGLAVLYSSGIDYIKEE